MSQNTPVVAAVILTCNQKDYTLNCLHSLYRCSYPALEIVIVDNNSSDATEEEVGCLYPRVHYVKNTFNAGVAGGRNRGIKYVSDNLDYDYLLILDNDTMVDRHFLEPMVSCFQADSSLGVVAPKIYLLGENNMLDQAGGSVVNFYTGSTAKRGFGEYDRGQYDMKQTQKCLPSGACSMSRRSTVEECDGLDEIFNPYGFEDLDYSLRAKDAGYRLAYCPQSIIYHKGNKTGFTEYSSAYAQIKGKHMRLFLKRHSTKWQKWCFIMLIPFLGLRSLVREARKGNAKAVLTLFRSYLGR